LTLSKEARQAGRCGSEEEVHVTWRHRYGRTPADNTTYEGVIPVVERRYKESESGSRRQRLPQFMREIPCRACKGARLKPESLAVTVGGVNIYQLTTMSISDTLTFVEQLELSDRERMIAERLLKEIRERLGFLVDVGLDYLPLA